MCGVTKLGRIRNERQRRAPEVMEISSKKSHNVKMVIMVWACGVKRGALRMMEGGGT